MALRYHYSTNLGTWARCQATRVELCYKDDFHGDRTAIAAQYGGAVVSYLQDGVIKDFTITPVIEGVYGVINRDGDSRTYRADNGELIRNPERDTYLREVILPRMRARLFSQMKGEDRAVTSEAPAENNRSRPLELPMSVLTEAAVRPGPAGREARGEQAEAAEAATPIRGLPSRREVAKAEKEERKGMAATLRGLFRRKAKAFRDGATDGQERSMEAELQRALFAWFYGVFGIRRH